MTHPAQAMVVLASEQLWPNIQGLVHWYRHEGGLKDLCIYYTDDPQRSAEPARRFARFAQKVFPKIRVHLPEKPGGKLPQDVYQQIVAWQREIPDRSWIINATGGLKLMFAGAIQALDLPNTEVVYGELSGEWFRWRKTPQGETFQPFALNPSETDDLPVQHLVQVQSPVAATKLWRSKTPQPLPVIDLVKHGIRTGWDWPECFRQVGLKDDQAGFLFERFVAAVLLELGIKQIALNAELLEENEQGFQEIDIVANYRGRILIFDCKLSGEGEENRFAANLTAQIRQAAVIRRDIGGLGAKLLLIRPGRVFRERERALAKDLGVDFLEKDDTLDFFRKIALFCGHLEELPPALAEAQRLLDQAREQGFIEALTRSNFLRGSFAGPPAKVIINLQSHLNAFMKERRQDWAVYKMADRTYLYFRLDSSTTKDEIIRRVHSLLQPLASVGSVWLSKPGKTGQVELLVHCSFKELQQFFYERLGQNIFSSQLSARFEDTDSRWNPATQDKA